MSGEPLAGPVVFVLGLVTFVAAVVATVTRRFDGLLVALLDLLAPATGVVAVVAACVLVLGAMTPRAHRVGVHADTDPDGDVEAAIRHEGHGHAAVGHGVGVRVGRVEVDQHGGGVTRLHSGDWRRASPAQRLAVLLAGERAAGPAGCSVDRRDYAAELRKVPRDRKAAEEAEAARLCSVHVGSPFGRRVARALERRGRFR